MSAALAPSYGDDTIHAERLHALFLGNENHRGRCSTDLMPDDKGKLVQSQKLTIHEGATVEHWREHLAGRCGLGVAPIRSDSTCVWGAIDVDAYEGSTPADMYALVKRHSLPLIVCRTKNEGAHILLFASEPVPARTMVAALRAVAARLRLDRWLAERCPGRKLEFFPKQTELGPGDTPNWLNMPYLGGTSCRDRYGVHHAGLAMAVEQFVAEAQTAQQSAEQMAALAASAVEQPRHSSPAARPKKAVGPAAEARMRALCDEIASAAPGDANNTLNNVAFRMGGLCRDAGLDQTRCYTEALHAWMLRGKHPSEFEEVWTRAFADGELEAAPLRHTGEGPQIERIVRVVGGERVVAKIWLRGYTSPVVLEPAGSLMRCNIFVDQCFEQLGAIFPPMRATDWTVVLSAIPSEEETIPQMETVEGRFLDELDEYLTNRHAGTTREELLLGRPIHDEDGTGRYYLRWRDFKKHLERSDPSLARLGDHRLGRLFRALGPKDSVGQTTLHIKGKRVPVHWIAGDLLRSLCGEVNEPLALPAIRGDPL